MRERERERERFYSSQKRPERERERESPEPDVVWKKTGIRHVFKFRPIPGPGDYNPPLKLEARE